MEADPNCIWCRGRGDRRIWGIDSATGAHEWVIIDCECVRLRAIARCLEIVNRELAELIPRVVELHQNRELEAYGLRAIGHELVSMAGDLTKLGVDTAHWADKLDSESDPPRSADDL